MNDWYEIKEHPPLDYSVPPVLSLPLRDVVHQETFRCASCGRQVWDMVNSESPNFLCNHCRKKWNVKPE